MSLSRDQSLRYERHLMLPEVGEAGQERWLGSSVLVVGAGGLGSPVGIYLAAAGVGRIGVVDGDRLELSNLQRQIAHGTPDVGRPKVESFRESTSTGGGDQDGVSVRTLDWFRDPDPDDGLYTMTLVVAAYFTNEGLHGLLAGGALVAAVAWLREEEPSSRSGHR